MSPIPRRDENDVLELQPFTDDERTRSDPEGVLGTHHDADTCTVYTVAGGGAALVLTHDPDPSRRATDLADDGCSPFLQIGLVYLLRDGIRTVRVRADPDTVESALQSLDSWESSRSYRYEGVTFTAERGD